MNGVLINQPNCRHFVNLSAVFNPKPLVAIAVLTLLVFALALPGIRSMPVTDRDEARYAQASRQMVESGDYVQIRFLDEARNKKPAGIYWLHTACVFLTGVKDEIWPYRLVSVFGAWLAVLLVYLLGRRIQPDAPLLPALALAACPLLVCVEHAATTDAVMMATVCAAQFCLARVYLGSIGYWSSVMGQNSERRTPNSAFISSAAVGFWIALGIGILVKGPITPLISILTILALCLHDRNFRWLRALRPGIGCFLLLLIVLPWLVAIQRKTNFLQEAVGHDFLTKVKGAQESHGAPPGAYLATAGFLFWPLFPLAWRGIGRAWQTRRQDSGALFLLAWLIPSWLVFELVPTKLPHYVLPLYPVLAFLAVRGWGGQAANCLQNTPGCNSAHPASPMNNRFDVIGGRRAVGAGHQEKDWLSSGWPVRIWRLTCGLADIVWFMAAAAFLIGPVLAARLLGWEWMPAAFGCAVVAGVATVMGWRARKQPVESVMAAVGFALLFFMIMFTCVIPRLDDLWLTRKIANMVARETHGKAARIVSVGYSEPSMAFTFGTRTILGGGVERAVQELMQDPSAIALIQDAPAPLPLLLPVGEARWAHWCQVIAVAPKNCQRESFLAAAAQAGLRVREVAAVDGLNYSRTKRVRVMLYRTAARETPLAE